MLYNIDLRFGVPVLVKIFIYLINRSSYTREDTADLILVWDYLSSTHRRSLFSVGLAFVLLLLVVAIKLSISVAVFAQPIILRFGDFNPSLPLVFLLIASFLFPPQGLLYAYFVCIFVWMISPWPSYVLAMLVNWLQHNVPVFIITAQQPPRPGPSMYLEDVDVENNDNREMNMIFGHA